MNPYSIFYTSPNELDVSVSINADGYQEQTMSTTKAAGGAEQKD